MSAHGAGAPPPLRAELAAFAAQPTPPGIKRAAWIAAIVGLLIFLIYLAVDADRAWRAFYINWLYFAAISSAGVTLAAVQRIATARWSREVVRFVEGFVAFLPVAFVFLVLIVTLGYSHIFPWAHVMPPVEEKRFYLAPGFFIPRVLILFAVIMILALWFVYTSVRLDVGVVPEAGASWAAGIRARMRRGFGDERRELHTTHSRQGVLCVFIILTFGFFWEALAFDLSMSLDMHFESTLYGWWWFMTAWIGAIMVFSLLTMWWRKTLHGESLVQERHFHDLGKLGFAFTAFWGYLTFGQYLVLWYGNMAEETHFFRLRGIGPWAPLTAIIAVLVFVLPFFGLLSRAAKVYLPTFALFAWSSIIGIWLQRYGEVYPSLYGIPAHMPLGIPELGLLLFYLGVWGSCYFAFMDAFPKMRVFLMTSQYRDEVQVPVDPRTMEPLPATE
jgi:hypothetical protein